MDEPIHSIEPFRYHGLWVFSDAALDLHQEPFVSGADVMIEKLVRGVPDADHGFVLLFSAAPFPGYQVHLEWLRSQSGGYWYRSKELREEGWLTGALLKYFPEPPPHIYVQARAKTA
ncbi:MAG TPA: DUF6717 family protein [Usitatibacter sp.]|nr:DUF6717 family protein [Usitatibacter sp.]